MLLYTTECRSRRSLPQAHAVAARTIYSSLPSSLLVAVLLSISKHTRVCRDIWSRLCAEGGKRSELHAGKQSCQTASVFSSKETYDGERRQRTSRIMRKGLVRVV